MERELLTALKEHPNVISKKQLILFLLNFSPISVEQWIAHGFRKNDLLQVVHKLKKDGYNIIYDKKEKKYVLVKNRPIILDVKITNKISPYRAYGILFNKIPVMVEFKNPLNGSKVKRIKCEVIKNENGIILREA